MKVFLKNARLSLAQGLYNPSAYKEGDTLKYYADLIVESDTEIFRLTDDGKKVATTLNEVSLAAAKLVWKDKAESVLKTVEPSKNYLRSGDSKISKSGDQYEGYEGKVYVTAKNPIQPTMLDRLKNKLEPRNNVFYSGCRVNASFDVYVMADPKGVYATLLGVQFVGDDVALGGARSSDGSEFDEVETTEEDLLA